MNDSEKLILSGWMTKQGGKRKNWQKRWFEIRGLQMRYFKDPHDVAKPLGVIALAFPLDREGIHSREVQKIPESEVHGRKNVFVIKGRNEESNLRPYMLQCETMEETATWIDTACRVIFSQQGGGMFGESLQQQVIKEGTGPNVLPLIATKCIAYLTDKALLESGVFRLPGRVTRVEELRQSFNRGEDPDISSEPEIHAVGSLFKRYLRDLPAPLLTAERFDAFLSAGHIYESNSEEGFEVLKKFIRDLPCANAVLLKTLCNFLHQVQLHSDVNMMTSGNLAVVFAPSFLAPPEDASATVLVQSQSVAQLITRVLIEHHDDAFALLPEADDEDWRPFRNKAGPQALNAHLLTSPQHVEFDNDDHDHDDAGSARTSNSNIDPDGRRSPKKPSLPNSSVLALVGETIGSMPPPPTAAPSRSPNGGASVGGGGSGSGSVLELQAELAEERHLRQAAEHQVALLTAKVKELEEAKFDLEEDLATEQVMRIASEKKNPVGKSASNPGSAPVKSASNPFR